MIDKDALRETMISQLTNKGGSDGNVFSNNDFNSFNSIGSNVSSLNSSDGDSKSVVKEREGNTSKYIQSLDKPSFCSECGANFIAEAKYCTQCGIKLHSIVENARDKSELSLPERSGCLLTKVLENKHDSEVDESVSKQVLREKVLNQDIRVDLIKALLL